MTAVVSSPSVVVTVSVVTAPQNRSSIQFSSIPLDPEHRSFGLRLSYAARERLVQAAQEGSARVRVEVEARIFDSEELTLVADVHGHTHPDERFVLSAHVRCFQVGLLRPHGAVANEHVHGAGVCRGIISLVAVATGLERCADDQGLTRHRHSVAEFVAAAGVRRNP